MKKYEFTEETINFMGRILHRIKACRDFGSVKEGDIGGFIEKEENLDHNGNAWVYENAKVFGNAEVSGNAEVFGEAMIYENAKIFGNAEVFGEAMIYENAKIFGNAEVSGNAEVFVEAMIYEEAEITGNARVFGNARIFGNAMVFGNSLIKDSSDYFVAGPIGSRGGFTTFYKTTTGIGVVCGCFNGSIEEFEDAVEKTHGDNEHAKAYNTAICLAKMIIKEETI